jgi:hypothetical protein
MSSQPSKKGHKRDYRVAIIVGVVLLAAGYGIASVIGGSEAPRKRVMETVAIKILPPPPPPKTEPPPPPPKMVEPPKMQPPMDKPPDDPKPGPLALDAKGGAGSDSFGLGGKPGGADFTGGGGGSPFGHYGAVAKAQIKRWLAENEKLAGAKYRETVKIWFTASGAVSRVEVLHGSGDGDVDGRVQQAIASMPALPEAPPGNMPAMILHIDAPGST